MLRSAGVAIQALTNRVPAAESSNTENTNTESTLETQKSSFKASSSQYFELLSSIDVRLRRQVYALEEASIIRPEASSTPLKAEGSGGGATGAGGNNPLEISWLNSRKDTVGKDKEAELWEEARNLVMKLDGSRQGDDTSHELTSGNGKEMDLD